MPDYILNGTPHGEVADTLAGSRFDPGAFRPYVAKNGQKYVTINTGELEYNDQFHTYLPKRRAVPVKDLIANGMASPVHNATLALRKDQWIQMDTAILKTARQRLRAWSDLAAANSFGGFNAFGRTILEHETLSDPGEAKVDMDGLTEGRSDQPLIQLEGLPLPITHSDFHMSSRKLEISRNGGGMPLDTTMAEAAGRRVAETIEKTLIGTTTGIQFGVAADYGDAPKVYGYTNHPDRATKTNLTASASFVGTTFVTELLAMLELLRGQNHFGPYMVYVSTAYDAKLDDDYKANSDKTVRQRIREIDDVTDVRRLDYLTGDVVLVVSMQPEVAQAVVGMDITTVQWETKGGMQLNFKVMAILVPRIRSDYSGNSGICHGTTS